ncbi:MAG: hypothetical protein NTY03_10420 [Candidatus Bathyarchaeota archaeon]|nr:hypothetical protein [Candidatus Bathyarchaeota archaeon]
MIKAARSMESSGNRRFESMLTIFTIPKPFKGHIGIIQRNAIQSWTRLLPECEIILFGDEPGAKEVAAEAKAKYVPQISRNEYGTPLLDCIFAEVHKIAQYHLLCYVNTDIILLSDFIKAVQRIRFQRFVMVGQRLDIDLDESWDFQKPDSVEKLRRYAFAHGKLMAPTGIDYFVFPRDCGLNDIPPFAVGRPGWDNWFIHNALKRHIPVVNVTKVVTVIHQNHDYSHVPKSVGKVWEGPEADRNRALIGDRDRMCFISDATHIMTSWAILPSIRYKFFWRRVSTWLIRNSQTNFLLRLLRKIYSFLHTLYLLMKRQIG